MVKDRFFVDFAKGPSRGAIEDFLDQGGDLANVSKPQTAWDACVACSRFRIHDEPSPKRLAERTPGAFREPFTFDLAGKRSVPRRRPRSGSLRAFLDRLQQLLGRLISETQCALGVFP